MTTNNRTADQRSKPGVCPVCKGAGGWANTARGRGVGGQMMTMCDACNGTGQQPAQLLAKHQPCGCIVCTCADDVRCHGCGARHCGTHPVSEIPNAVYEQAAGGGEVRDYLRAECNHFVNGRCDTRGCMAKLPNGALEIPVRFVGCGNYRAVQELSRLQSALTAAQQRIAELEGDSK